MFADDQSRLIPCFAGSDALIPRAIKFCVTGTSAFPKPRTTATATTPHARFPDRAAFGAYGTDCRRRGCWSAYVGVGHRHKRRTRYNNHRARMHLPPGIYFKRTFASLQTLKPPVIYVSVAGTSAVLKPSTARSATTAPARFLERAAFGARHRFSDR